MKFSVLMSLYDKESPIYYHECLESISNQTLKPDEVVIVYDGFINSELRKVTERFIDFLNIMIIEIENNVGLGQALNIGLTRCNFEVVLRMDSDDICFEDRFEKQIGFFLKNPDCDIVGGGIVEINTDTGSETTKILPLANDDIIKYAEIKNPINHMAVGFMKSKVISCGSYVHHLYMEDYNLWLRSIQSGLNIQNMPDLLVKARVGEGMLTRRRGFKYIKSEYILFKLKRTALKNNMLYDLFVFLFRSITRIVPLSLLRFLYKIDRRGK